MQKSAQSASLSAPYNLAALRGFFARGVSRQSVTNHFDLALDLLVRRIYSKTRSGSTSSLNNQMHSAMGNTVIHMHHHNNYFMIVFDFYFMFFCYRALAKKRATCRLSLSEKLRNVFLVFSFFWHSGREGQRVQSRRQGRVWPWMGALARGVSRGSGTDA